MILLTRQFWQNSRMSVLGTLYRCVLSLVGEFFSILYNLCINWRQYKLYKLNFHRNLWDYAASVTVCWSTRKRKASRKAPLLGLRNLWKSPYNISNIRTLFWRRKTRMSHKNPYDHTSTKFTVWLSVKLDLQRMTINAFCCKTQSPREPTDTTLINIVRHFRVFWF